MNCSEVQIHLLDYSKGALSGHDRKAVESHLRECAECEAFMREEAAFAARLASRPQETPTRDMWDSISARTRPRHLLSLATLTALAGTNVYRLAAAGTAAIVAAVIAAVAFHGIDRPPQTPVVSEQKPPAVTVHWSDDPLGSETDAMIDAIENL